MNGRCDRFRDRADTKDIEEKKAALEGKFGDLVLKDTETELGKILKGINYGGRCEVRATAIGGLSASNIAKRDLFGGEGNRILVQFILARDDQDHLRIPDKARELAKQFKDHRMLFVTLPEVSFCRDNANAWNEFVVNNARLALASDSASKRVFETQTNSAKADWNSKVTNAAKLTLYKPNANGEPFIKEVTWGQLKKDWLTEYAKQAFGAFTDHFCSFNISAFAAPNALQNWAQAGIEFDRFAKPGAWKTVVATWQKNGIAGNEEWFDENPKHPLAQMRDFCKKRLDNTVGAGNECSIRKLYIDLQRPPYGLLMVPHSAFVLGFVLKPWLTGQRKLQWTDGVTSKALDAVTLAEIIEAVVKDDGSNAIKNEKRICRLSNEEKTFIEQCSVIFGHSPLSDGTVEAALNAVATRLEQISQRVPLWVLPDYIRAKFDSSAESMGKVIDALCAANSISSKGDTEIRGNRVKEIGGILRATPGLAAAMAQYMTPVKFDEAFQQYVDNAKPELKEAAKRMGDTSHTYCKEAKRRFAATSGWLWKRGDTEAILEDVYRQVLCAEHICGLAGASGYLDFEDAMSRLQKAVSVENKVPLEFWAKKHPAFQRFFELLFRKPLAGEDVIDFEGILEQQGKVIRELFFDVTQARQLSAMEELFREIWPKAVSESRDLYSTFPPESANTDEQSFKVQGRARIEKFSQTLVSKQVIKLWREHTGTESPDEWSLKHRLPAECVLNVAAARSIVDAVANPGEVSPERLQSVCDELAIEGAFLDVAAAGEKFIKRVLPARYRKVDFNVRDLCDWLSAKLEKDPGRWLTDGMLHERVEEFVRQGYNTHARKKAKEMVNALSDAEAKKRLLKLIDEIPAAGFSLLE